MKIPVSVQVIFLFRVTQIGVTGFEFCALMNNGNISVALSTGAVALLILLAIAASYTHEDSPGVITVLEAGSTSPRPRMFLSHMVTLGSCYTILVGTLTLT